MPRQLARVRPGDPITAAAFNALVDTVNLLARTTGSFPVEVRRNAAGIQIGLARPLVLRKGKLDQPLAYRSSAGALVSLYGGEPGSETVSGDKATAHDWHLLPGESLDAGTTVTLARIDSHWYVIAAACEAEPGAGTPSSSGFAASSFTSTAALAGPHILPFNWGS